MAAVDRVLAIVGWIDARLFVLSRREDSSRVQREREREGGGESKPCVPAFVSILSVGEIANVAIEFSLDETDCSFARNRRARSKEDARRVFRNQCVINA